MILQKNLNN